MTLIECFHDSLVESMTVCLRFMPDRLILLGNAAQMSAPARRFQGILEQRKLRTKVVLFDLLEKSLSEITAALTKIVQGEEKCVIDLTDGDEIAVMAIGAMIAGMDDQTLHGISVQKYDPEKDRFTQLLGNPVVAGQGISLTIQELVALHGGIIHPGSYQPPKDSTPAQLEPLWDLVAQAPKDWNRTISVLNEFESYADSKTEVFLMLRYLQNSIANFEEKVEMIRELLGKLSQRGIIKDDSSRDCLHYTYTSPILQYCMQKAGNALEVKVLLEARALLKNGKPFFSDCQTGVNIDWDGIVYDPMERMPETRNEIDVVLMSGLTPLFISCKNGNIGDEELYKLHTVAQRFGGPHARKMLIATDLDRKSHAANRSFSQRAWDMDIFLVTDAAELSKEEWRQVFLQAMQ